MRASLRRDVLLVLLWGGLGGLCGYLAACAGGVVEGSEIVPACHPSEAQSTALWYVPTEDNTAVLLIAHCPGLSTVWYVSFFTGEQPDMWNWYEIQNTAGILLREGSSERFVTNDVERFRARR